MQSASLKASFGVFSDLGPFALLSSSVLGAEWALKVRQAGLQSS